MFQQKQLESTFSHDSLLPCHGQTTEVNTLDLLPLFLVSIPPLIFYSPASSSAHSKVTQGFLVGLWPWSLPTLGSLQHHRMSDIDGYSI